MTSYNNLTAFIGPSGAGKSAHLQRLTHDTGAVWLQTDTDRPKRSHDEDDTHNFISTEEFREREKRGYYLGVGAFMGYNYGLPHLPETNSPVFVALRAPFVPTMHQFDPTIAVVQFEASPETLVARLLKRGEPERADPTNLQKEILLGRTFTKYLVSTDKPFDVAHKDLMRIWDEIHQA